MAICGNAISGYCAIGKLRIASPPAIMVNMASTHAKMGRLMKKAAMCYLIVVCASEEGCTVSGLLSVLETGTAFTYSPCMIF